MSGIVYLLETEYIDLKATEEGSTDTIKGHEVNAVYSTEDAAKSMGEWLIKQDYIGGRKYTSYKISDFIVI